MKFSRKYKNILDNRNLNFYMSGKDLYVCFEPYDRTLEDIEYIKRWLINVKQVEDEIKEHYNVDYFAINLASYNLDGLTETNNELVFDRSYLYSNYVDEFRKIKL